MHRGFFGPGTFADNRARCQSRRSYSPRSSQIQLCVSKLETRPQQNSKRCTCTSQIKHLFANKTIQKLCGIWDMPFWSFGESSWVVTWLKKTQDIPQLSPLKLGKFTISHRPVQVTKQPKKIGAFFWSLVARTCPDFWHQEIARAKILKKNDGPCLGVHARCALCRENMFIAWLYK